MCVCVCVCVYMYMYWCILYWLLVGVAVAAEDCYEEEQVIVWSLPENWVQIASLYKVCHMCTLWMLCSYLASWDSATLQLYSVRMYVDISNSKKWVNWFYQWLVLHWLSGIIYIDWWLSFWFILLYRCCLSGLAYPSGTIPPSKQLLAKTSVREKERERDDER